MIFWVLPKKTLLVGEASGSCCVWGSLRSSVRYLCDKNKFLLYNVLFDEEVVRIFSTHFEVSWEFLIHAILKRRVAGDGELALRVWFTFHNAARDARSPPTTLLALRARSPIIVLCCSRFALAALALRARAQNYCSTQETSGVDAHVGR